MSFLVEDLRARAGDFEVTLPHLEIQPGEIVCLMGKSGAGKSTLLEALAGFRSAQGSIRIDGKSLEGLPPERRRIALVFQRGSLFPHLSVENNVAFGLRMQGMAAQDREIRSKDWLVRLGIPELAARFPGEISEGQAQRVALARALAVGFPVLLMDEPFSALDEQTRGEIRPVVKRLIEESRASALLVTHQNEDILAIGGRLYRIEQGRCFPD